jgi:hypothetical protein
MKEEGKRTYKFPPNAMSAATATLAAAVLSTATIAAGDVEVYFGDGCFCKCCSSPQLICAWSWTDDSKNQILVTEVIIVRLPPQ